MACHKQLFVSFLLLLIATTLHGQRSKKFFRKDYKYIEDTESFYKIHTIHKKWNDAQQVCASEGATLFYPEDQKEADAVRNFWNQTQPQFYWVFVGISAQIAKGVFETVDVCASEGATLFYPEDQKEADAVRNFWNQTQPQFYWVFVGISAQIAKGVFETVDGIPVADVYSNWGPGEPNDANGEEDCVILRRDGTLNDDNCNKSYPFVCKKTLRSLEWNTFCNMPNLDYTYEETVGRCYKFHLDPKTWQEAYATCSAEQSYLAIINSQEEADLLVRMTENAPKDSVGGDYLRGVVHLGFHKRPQGWTTIKGTKLEDSGYSKWGNQQPDNSSGEEDCGTMFLNGQLNDITCVRKSFFICEHDVDILSTIFDDRFGNS